MSLLRRKEKQARIAAELSALVIYCVAVPFTPRAAFSEMCSFSESKLGKLIELGSSIPAQVRSVERELNGLPIARPRGVQPDARESGVPKWGARHQLQL